MPPPYYQLVLDGDATGHQTYIMELILALNFLHLRQPASAPPAARCCTLPTPEQRTILKHLEETSLRWIQAGQHVLEIGRGRSAGGRQCPVCTV